jgi:hypothetical protein
MYKDKGEVRKMIERARKKDPELVIDEEHLQAVERAFLKTGYESFDGLELDWETNFMFRSF